MLLAINIEKIYTHFCLIRSKEDISKACFFTSTDAHRSADTYSTFLVKKLNDIGITYGDITNIIVSSKIPSINIIMRELAHRFLNMSPTIIEEDPIDWGFTIDIPNPAEAALDVLVDIVAAKSLYGSPSLVINFNDLTTMVATNKEGNPYGGIVLPGCNLMKSGFSDYYGLGKDTTLVYPYTPLKYPLKVIGNTTPEALESGIILGHIHAVRGLIRDALNEGGPDMFVIATGSYASSLEEHIPEITYWDSMLTMHGLHQLYERNKHMIENKNIHFNLKRM